VPQPLVPLRGDLDVRVGDLGVVLQDPPGLGRAGRVEVPVFVSGEVGA